MSARATKKPAIRKKQATKKPAQKAEKAENGGRFKPGQSGNPAGRPKVVAVIRDMAREHGKEAVEKLVEIMRGDDPKLARAAACDILDRGYGKPTQMIASDDDAGGLTVVIRQAIGGRAQ